MPLGLLAKDSIQDLTALGKESDARETDSADNESTLEDESSHEHEHEQLTISASPKTVATKASPADAESPRVPPSSSSSSSGASSTSSSVAAPPVANDDDDDVPQTAANPQQAQEEDDDDEGGVIVTQKKPRRFPETNSYGQYSGFRADYYTSPGSHSNNNNNIDDEHLVDEHGTYHFHDSYAPAILSERNPSLFPNFPLCCLFPWLAAAATATGRTSPSDKDDSHHAGDFEAESYEQETVDHSRSRNTTATTTTTTTTTKKKKKTMTPHPPNAAAKKKSGTLTTDDVDDDDEISSGSDVLGEKLSAKERQAVLARLGLAQPDVESSRTPTTTTTTTTTTEKKGLLNGIPTYDTSPLQNVIDGEASSAGLLAAEDGATPNNKKLKSILKRGSTSDMSSLNKQGQDQKNDKNAANRRRSLFPSYESSSSQSKSLQVSFAPMARVVTVRSKNSMASEEKGDVWWQKTDYEEFRKTGRIVTKAMLTGGSEIWLSNTTPRASLEPVKAAGDKWWHKFGHSRRGLEHVVSMEEGRDRQINVRNAIRAVLDEQSRQKMYKREDPDKLRIVSLNHTTWARDLAFAAGASDADAVKANFAEDRKSREFYLLKMARAKPASSSRTLPKFMVPEAKNKKPSVPSPRQMIAQRLDANTAAQICFRRRQSGKGNNGGTTTPRKETSEPIHDPDPEEHTNERLAHRAAGFMVDGAERVDMAAVLSGMGAVPQESAAS